MNKKETIVKKLTEEINRYKRQIRRKYKSDNNLLYLRKNKEIINELLIEDATKYEVFHSYILVDIVSLGKWEIVGVFLIDARVNGGLSQTYIKEVLIGEVFGVEYFI